MNTHTLLTAILVVLALGICFMMGRMTAPLDPSLPATGSQQENNGSEQETANGVSEESSDSGTIEGGATVRTSDLTAGQRKLLEALGIDADEVTITPEMVACAEAKLGSERIEEIKNGAAPLFTEGARLVACYQ